MVLDSMLFTLLLLDSFTCLPHPLSEFYLFAQFSFSWGLPCKKNYVQYARMQGPAICVCVLPILISYCHFLCLCSLGLNLFLVQNKLNLVALQINADGVKRNFYPGDKLPLWHDELEPHNSLLDILAAGNPDPMVQWICPPLPLWTFHWLNKKK